ncbi:family 16 glycoside hydrolase [Methanocaldococcus fervens]|nr:family 16 glycoside hydrolase [Methanocaldococcus fervens]
MSFKKVIAILTISILYLGLCGCFEVGPKQFYDDFSSYTMGEKAPFGEWKVKEGGFKIEGIMSEDKKSINNVAVPINNGIIYIDKNYTNFELIVDIKRFEDKDNPKIYFRLVNNAQAGYFIEIERYDRGYALYKFNGSKVEKLAESYSAAPAGTDFYRYKVIAKDNKIVFLVGGQKYIEYTDNNNPILKGGIGIGGGRAYYDNVRVTPLE